MPHDKCQIKRRLLCECTLFDGMLLGKPMDLMKLCCVLVLLVVGALVWGRNGVQRCDFPTIYNFGDSNSDTGGISSAALKEVPTPDGETFFGHPSGRFCDGRLIIDFLGK